MSGFRNRFTAFAIFVASSIALLADTKPATSSAIREFDAANKLYEEGNFATAIPAYLQLLRDGSAAPSVYFNLGNAYFKVGLEGRAIVSYLRAARLAPRDAEIRTNLQFVRDRLSPSERLIENPAQRFASWLTVGELTVAASASYWLCFALLGAAQLRPSWRARTLLPCWVSALCCLLAIGWLTVASHGELSAQHGVVVAPEAVVRLGPLDESQSSHSLSDGAEVTILERRPDWLRIRDVQNRTGWLRSTQLAVP